MFLKILLKVLCFVRFGYFKNKFKNKLRDVALMSHLSNLLRIFIRELELAYFPIEKGYMFLAVMHESHHYQDAPESRRIPIYVA